MHLDLNAPALIDAYQRVRAQSARLCEPLAVEDYSLQGMADASPPKWHLAHTTWFFETFILKHHEPDFAPFHPAFEYLFNSYYNGIGAQYPRPQRGLLSRPTVAEVMDYRAQVDQRMLRLLQDDSIDAALGQAVHLGLHHEQQHQELLLTDLKYSFSLNSLHPVYRARERDAETDLRALGFLSVEGGLYDVGHHGGGFHFDNETPRHKHYVQPFRIADRLITNGEYLAFIDAGGYQKSELWLSDGWAAVTQRQWRHPLYWQQHHQEWLQYQLSGLQPLDLNAPVTHISLYEADAYARWRGMRLPTEFEWEVAVTRWGGDPAQGHFVESERLAPKALSADGDHRQFFGDCWEWTTSAYGPYPGYQPFAGAFGEYNGKFMCNQAVLRGGSCVTPAEHIRASYRNFFYPPDRWQFTGIRLVQN